jgi:hypothetical protein
VCEDQPEAGGALCQGKKPSLHGEETVQHHATKTRRPATPKTRRSPAASPAADPASLSTDAGMAAYLTYHLGPAGWAYDPLADQWIVPVDFELDGPGRGFVVLRRGGDWRHVVLPPESVQ